jgi:hypothetical protein
MSDYMISFENGIRPTDMNKLHNMLGIIGESDEIEITINSNDGEKMGTIIKTLSEKDFEVSTKGSHDGQKYNIHGKRRSRYER